MNSLVLSALLILGAGPQTAASINLPEGTLLFLTNASSVVERSTGGEIGHVALAFAEEGQTYIYEATPAKVRRVSQDEYFAELARINRRRDADEQVEARAMRPKRAYTDAELAAMRSFLSEQIGRRYSVKNYVKGKPGDGIHCAELASTTLNESGRYEFDRRYRIHPHALYLAVQPTHLPPQSLTLPAAASETWCVRSQRRCAEWFTWCGWSCREAWSFCW
ncbi:MAG: hypothetical protein MUF06_23390 [Pirellulaceae bacterium]|jgi:hypothetical protein|nr:hypothetical protein [Pirellulaceae bacterium]